jgi:hypothetical protein
MHSTDESYEQNASEEATQESTDRGNHACTFHTEGKLLLTLHEALLTRNMRAVLRGPEFYGSMH